MHEHGMQPVMQQQQQDMLTMEMWEILTDDQKITLMKRMLHDFQKWKPRFDQYEHIRKINLQRL